MFKHRLAISMASLMTVLVALGILSAADADPGTTGLGFDDAYTQIVNHNIPLEPDGKPTYFSGGRHYVGPNGWEIRFNHKRTMKIIAVEHVIVTEGAGIASGAILSAAVAALAPETTLGALIVSVVDSKAFESIGTVAGGIFDNFAVSPAIDTASKTDAWA